MSSSPLWKSIDDSRKARKKAKDAEKRKELNWAREQVRLRSGGLCEAKFSQYCGGVGQAIHHVKLRSQGGKNDPESCLWVCNSCHSQIHSYPLLARQHGLLEPSWGPE